MKGVTTVQKLAFLCPGQGSTYIGMGWDMYRSSQSARAVFDQASELLGFNLLSICARGPEKVLQSTYNSQLAVFVTTIANYRLIQQIADDAPDMVAGHSLGELSALVIAGSLDFASALLLIHKRGQLMHEASQLIPGEMQAIIGLNKTDVQEICDEFAEYGIVVIANYNCPGQIVISGEKALVKEAVYQVNRMGGKAIKLPVEGAFHSPVMEQARRKLRPFIRKLAIKEPKIPFYSGTTGERLTSPDAIRKCLRWQMVRPVNWDRTIRNMLSDGATGLLELEPHKKPVGTLTGFLRRIQSTL